MLCPTASAQELRFLVTKGNSSSATLISRGTDLSNFRVALLVETSSGYGRSVLAGVSRYVRTRHDWSIFFAEHELAAGLPAWVHNWQGQGVICRHTPKQLVDSLRDRTIPLVDLPGPVELHDCTTIHADEVAIARLAAEHFLERGYKRFAFCGYENAHWSSQRCKAFTEHLRSRGHSHCETFSTPWPEFGVHAVHDDLQRLSDWIQGIPKPFGMMAANDTLGHYVDAACLHAGVAIPEEVAVIGVDNDATVCNMCSTPLSSVTSDVETVGYLAAESLARLMEGSSDVPLLTLVPPRGIKTRQSTDAYATEDSEIMEALRFIRANACAGATVEDVAKHVAMSRSTLERRMRDAINRTPKQQIRYVRISKAQMLLSDSNESLARIAAICGFDHPEYLHVMFKREVGVTPGEFRRSALGE